MPLRGNEFGSSVQDEAPFFESLALLDDWVNKKEHSKLDGVLSYHPRKAVDGIITENKGKLLICHDYKGGYTEKPDALAYTFNFWSYCETFVYFSHHRITIPPTGWTTAAHRHGVKMLGTLIFEDSAKGSAKDCLRILIGESPEEMTTMKMSPLPISTHYAKVLARLARQRGFDGWLLNFESRLGGGVEQARGVAAWIGLLKKELKREVGEHAEVIWYDSVTIDGQVQCQNRLNDSNLPFFIPSTGFYSDYVSELQCQYPRDTELYYLRLNSVHPGLALPLLCDIYMGVDVWGCELLDGGGFGAYKALNCIDPKGRGLSAAVFGPAWTWETEECEKGFNWDVWWDYERKLWVGSENSEDKAKIPENDEPVPLVKFFPRRPPPNPMELAFFTSFSPGIGRSWFVSGKKVLETKSGWTDVHKSTCIGDLLWPRPTLDWESSDYEGGLPKVTCKIDQDDAWIGGNSLDIILTPDTSKNTGMFFRSVWLPIQTLAITPQKTYETYIVYKSSSSPSEVIKLNVGLTVKALSGAVTNLRITSVRSTSALMGEWERLCIQFRIHDALPSDVLSAAGLIISIVIPQYIQKQTSTVSIKLGALAVYPAYPASDVDLSKMILPWARFSSTSGASSPLEGVLTWSVSSIFPAAQPIPEGLSQDDAHPQWLLESSIPSLFYSNIYVQRLPEDSSLSSPEDAIFIGTTGLDGTENRFYVDKASIPSELEGATRVRFHVQGVTDRGEVIPWDKCTFVDVKV